MVAAPADDASPESNVFANRSITSMSPMSVSQAPDSSSANRGVVALAGVVVAGALLFALLAGVAALAVAMSSGTMTPAAVATAPVTPVGLPPPIKAVRVPSKNGSTVVAPVDAPPVDAPPVDAPPVDAPPEVVAPEEPPPPPPGVVKVFGNKPPVEVKAVAPPEVTGTVTVVGDAQKVMLTDGKRELSPDGPIPVGTWQIKAWFDGPTSVGAGKVVISADKPATIKCNASLLQCRAF